MVNNVPPLTTAQWQQLVDILRALTPEQIQWVSGFVAGYALHPENKPAINHPELIADAQARITVQILYGSQTGNAERLANEFHDRLLALGYGVKLESMARYKPSQLKRDSHLLIIVSTHGEGEPPDNATIFHDYLKSTTAPRLEHLRYAVLALGDSSYEYFCQTGRDFDERLAELGAEPMFSRIDCDVEFETPAATWFDQVLAALGTPEALGKPPPAVGKDTTSGQYSRKRPYEASLLTNLPLTAPGSEKDVRHIVLSLEDSGMRYTPGDALGVIPVNAPPVVENLIQTLNLYHADTVETHSTKSTSLEKALLHDYEITTVTRPFLEGYAKLAQSTHLCALLKPEQRQACQAWLRGREILDVIREYPVTGLTAQGFLGLLRKLPPRLYSIASSYSADPDEVHLTVAVVRYESHGIERLGVASTYLAERVDEGNTVPIYVHENPNFRLPEDPSTPIIMIGPGTGVAPFRSFLSEREAIGATGRNWLFFGDRHFDTDFLYQTEWLDYRRKGILTRMDVAFSRDSAEKVYVQHRLREHARDIHAWLREGAHIYVCGDGQQMATDVHTALLDILAEQGGLGPEEAREQLLQLQATKRYQRDVY